MNVQIRCCNTGAANAGQMFEQVTVLLSRAAKTAGTPSMEAIARIAGEDLLFLAYRGDALVGLLHFRILRTLFESQLDSRIERVTIDPDERGSEAADRLIKEAIAAARKSPVRRIDVTSDVSNKQLNELFLANGIAPRDAHSYQLSWAAP